MEYKCGWCNKTTAAKALVSRHTIPACCRDCGSHNGKDVWTSESVNELVGENARLAAEVERLEKLNGEFDTQNAELLETIKVVAKLIEYMKT